MADISLTVTNKIATASAATKGFIGVCNNTGYTLEVILDSEWNGLTGIKAIFRNDNEITEVTLTSSGSGKYTCNIPAFNKHGQIEIGISHVTKSGQTVQTVKATTGVLFSWKRSVLSGVNL